MTAKQHIYPIARRYPALLWLAVLMVTTLLPLQTQSNETHTAGLDQEAARLMGVYDVYWKGLRVFTAESTMELSRDRYQHSATMRSRGLLRLFLKAEARAESHGKLINGTPRPQQFISESSWDDDVYARTVAFDTDGRATVLRDIEPEDSDWIRVPVPDSLMIGPDPMSLLVAAIHNHWQLPATDSSTPILFSSFDGVRSTAYEAQCENELEELESTGKSVFAGPALRCNIKGETTGGYTRTDEEEDEDLKKASEEADEAEENARDEGVTIWLAKSADQRFMVPVRMELQGRRGKLKVYLAESGLQFN